MRGGGPAIPGASLAAASSGRLPGARLLAALDAGGALDVGQDVERGRQAGVAKALQRGAAGHLGALRELQRVRDLARRGRLGSAGPKLAACAAPRCAKQCRRAAASAQAKQHTSFEETGRHRGMSAGCCMRHMFPGASITGRHSVSRQAPQCGQLTYSQATMCMFE